MIYLIGSLRNDEVPKIGNKLREAGLEVFDDWYSAGPEADDKWRDYEKKRGRSFKEALSGAAARNVFEFDKKHLDSADAAILVLPAGRSGGIELGYCVGKRRTYILLDSPERWDVMFQFADVITDNLEDIINAERAQQTQITEQANTPRCGVCGSPLQMGKPVCSWCSWKN